MRHRLKALDLCDGVWARVRLKVGNDNVESALCGSVAIRKHLESFSHACGIPEVDL